jgi:hypothetical protein
MLFALPCGLACLKRIRSKAKDTPIALPPTIHTIASLNTLTYDRRREVLERAAREAISTFEHIHPIRACDIRFIMV